MHSFGAYHILAVWLAAVNISGFIAMCADKRRAIRHARRISEAALFLIAVVGGSIGSIAGMLAFRHKTRHASFVIGMPLILLAQTALFISSKYIM